MKRCNSTLTTNILKACDFALLAHCKPCLAALASLLLCACATMNDADKTALTLAWIQHRDQISAIEQWELYGAVDFSYREQRWNLNMRWLCSRHSTVLDLYTVHGDKLMELRVTPHEASARDGKGQSYTARNGAALAQKLLGIQAPLGSLCQWLIGLPDTYEAAPQIELDGRGRLAVLTQFDWRLSYQAYQDHQYTDTWVSMPHRLILEKGDMRITMLIAQRELM